MKLLLHFAKGNARLLGNYVDLLEQYSFVKSENGYLYVHRLVQQVTRLELKEKGNEEKFIVQAFELLQQEYPSENNAPDTTINQRNLVPHFEHIYIAMCKWIIENPTDQSNMERKCILPLLRHV